MIIVSNCLTNSADEGSRTVAANLIRRIRAIEPDTMVIADQPDIMGSDLCLPMSKLMLNPGIIRQILKAKQPVLHVPSPTRSLPVALRMFLMSLYARKGLYVLISMHYPISRAAAWLMKWSRAHVITISGQAHQAYRDVIGERALYIPMGVDTERFHPVEAAQKAALRQKYGLPQDKTIILHVGHLNEGRNVGQMLKLDDRFHGVLIVSPKTAAEQDQELRKKLESKANLTLIGDYVPAIEEYYQLSDVYLFPVEAEGHCIDVPISALEAAACGIPVAGTPYGELAQLIGQEGFEKIASFEADRLNEQLMKMAQNAKNPRQSALAYDWQFAAGKVLTSVKKGSRHAAREVQV